jgi:hypothetical protein
LKQQLLFQSKSLIAQKKKLKALEEKRTIKRGEFIFIFPALSLFAGQV